VITLDVESCSPLDLRRVGAYRYWAHPDTRVICLSYSINGALPALWFPDDAPPPVSLIDALTDDSNLAYAHNAVFERLALRTLPLPQLDLTRWRCTQARAAYYGLPLSLDNAAAALGLPVQKDKDGAALMKRMARPRKINPDGSYVWWDRTDPDKRDRLGRYCTQDVIVTNALVAALPAIPAQERLVYQMDQEINDLGVRVDVPLVHKLARLSEQAKAHLDQDMAAETGGAVLACSNSAALVQWLKSHGVKTESVSKQAIIDLLALPNLPDQIRKVLTLRQEASKTSLAKLDVLLDAALPDTHRVHGTLQYYGANRTGRWAGRLLQTHNLPRPAFKHPERAADAVAAGMDLEGLDLFFPTTPLTTMSSVIRACFVPRPGHRFVVCDFAGIEARVVAWLAGQQDTLDVFERGEDIYVYTAAKIGSDSRALGKALVLGCGYGLGPAKFAETAHQWGAKVTPVQAEQAVSAWRQANPKIVEFWYSLDRAVRMVLRQRGPREASCSSPHINVARHYLVGEEVLTLTLPSKRKLYYWSPRLTEDDQIEVWGPDPVTKAWGPLRTYGGKLVENVTQAVARDLLVRAMWEMRRLGWDIVLHVHDEIVVEAPERLSRLALRDIKAAMTSPPPWAAGLPLEAAGGILTRYGKPD
jgi:DNA polymerase